MQEEFDPTTQENGAADAENDTTGAENGENEAAEGLPEGSETPEELPPVTSEEEDGAVDYEALAAEDLKELKAEFPELSGMKNLAELGAAMRYAELRDLGLTPKEAYLATAPQRNRATAMPDNRSHLLSGVPKRAAPQSCGMNAGEMTAARELFSGLTDGEIRSLYRRVTAERR